MEDRQCGLKPDKGTICPVSLCEEQFDEQARFIFLSAMLAITLRESVRERQSFYSVAFLQGI